MTRDQQVPLTVMTWKIRDLIWNRNPELSNIFAHSSKIITTNNSKNNNWEWEAKIIKKFSKSGNSCFYRTFGNWLQISRQFRVKALIFQVMTVNGTCWSRVIYLIINHNFFTLIVFFSFLFDAIQMQCSWVI